MHKPLVLLIRNAASGDFGGAERLPVFIAGGLNNVGYSATVVSASNKLASFAEYNKVPVIKGLWWSRQNWSGVYALLTPVYIIWQLFLTIWYVGLFIRLHPSVIHIQSRDDFIAGTIAGAILGIRVVWSDYADLKHIWKNITIWHKNPVGKMVYLCAHIAHVITVVSQNDKAEITSNLPSKGSIGNKLKVLYVGVSDKNVQPINRDDEKIIFCSANRIVADKGVGELIDAFSRLRKERDDVELWILGDGPERSSFNLDQPGIVFFGHMSDPLPYIKASDVFVLPTYHEGFSVALVEASMLGRAIIATSVGGNTEIIKDESTGLLVNAKDSGDLFRAMQRMCNDEQLRSNFGESARKQYEQKYEFKKMLNDGVVSLYE